MSLSVLKHHLISGLKSKSVSDQMFNFWGYSDIFRIFHPKRQPSGHWNNIHRMINWTGRKQIVAENLSIERGDYRCQCCVAKSLSIHHCRLGSKKLGIKLHKSCGEGFQVEDRLRPIR